MKAIELINFIKYERNNHMIGMWVNLSRGHKWKVEISAAQAIYELSKFEPSADISCYIDNDVIEIGE